MDEPPRELLYVWWDAPDDDMLLTDADTAETFHLPPNQIAEQAVWRVFPHTPMRVQCWADRPVWVCGPT